MKKMIAVAMLLGVWSVTNAQRATGTKQDEILANQEKMEEKIKALESNQEKLMKLYGSEINPEDQVDLMSYAYGVTIGESFKKQNMTEMNYGAFMKGFTDMMLDKETTMTMQEAQKVINQYMTVKMQEQARINQAKGEEFLKENAERDEVKVTESGLQYEVVKEGKGDSPVAESEVTVHYEGSLISGEVFDSSRKRGQPATFGLNQVIKGWTEGLQLMKPGAVYKFYIPSELGYGDKGAGAMIGPGETLIFEVELISVN